MARALLFDLMDTVVHDPYREAIRAATGLEARAAFRINDPQCWPEFEVAQIDEAEFVRRFFPSGEPPFDLEAFHRTRRAGYHYLPGMRELLIELQGRVERYVASNYPIWIEELRVSLALDEHFEGIFASHHLGVRKPDTAFFERLLERIERTREECFFVDDRAQNCEAAERFGIRAYHFQGAPGLRARLLEEGIPTKPA
jgi:HAD superfamily hydrolase (TIGR01509 family)